jgi:hypothetical protein
MVDFIVDKFGPEALDDFEEVFSKRKYVAPEHIIYQLR